MAKRDYSGAVKKSLDGRLTLSTEIVQPKITPVITEELTNTDRLQPTEEKKKRPNNVGRKKLDDKKKKKQMVLTLTPDTYNRLMKWAESKSRTAPNYVSEFIEEHIDEII